MNAGIHDLRWVALSLIPLAAACHVVVNEEEDTGSVPSEVGAEGSTCGQRDGEPCETGLFCDYDLAAACGAADLPGTCQPIPSACTREYAPVCGCDDRTYGNACTAHAAGVAVAAVGECNAPPAACGGLGGLSCASGSFCNYALDAICGAADQTGLCEPIPEACPKDYAPVCGCDDRTYGNACSAHAAGVSVAVIGACPEM